VTAARHADLAFFERGILLGDLMRALEKQGLDKKVVKSEVIQRFGLYQSPNVLFRVHCRDLVDIIFQTRDAAAIAEAADGHPAAVYHFRSLHTAAAPAVEVHGI
jgi:hypothetical protein